MSTNDKRELLKLKQGLIEDSEIIHKEEREKVKLHGKKWVENFFYHHKVAIFVVLFLTLLGTLFIIEAVTKKRADIDFLFVTSTREANILMHDYNYIIGEAIGLFCPDFDNNGYVYAQSFPVNLFEDSDANMIITNQTKLFGEIQMGTSRLILADRRAFEIIIGIEHSFEDVFVNLSRLYPYNDNITDSVFFEVRGSEFATVAGIEEIVPDDMYFAVLSVNLEKDKARQAHERALAVLDNIVNGKITAIDN
ncbi:MAG: hypothetical protein FWH08_06680 [Oscillospiraceae bacterium]|nr:hypothetical protein [Oscillospiraceae bacterium]